MKQIPCMATGQSVTMPLSHHAIISLHAVLLTPGMHRLVFKNTYTPSESYAGRVLKCRSTLRSLISSLNCFSSIGILTMQPVTGIPASWHIVYDEMVTQGVRDQSALIQFCSDYFEYDCVLIEETPALRRASWYHRFLRTLHDMHLETCRSICILSYDT